MSQPPQVNLKERIAALQQKNAASSTTGSASSSLAGGQPRNLRDKISQFEQKGGVPIPRGSFGLGAPPVSGGQRSRELYGNRIPAPVRVSGNSGNGPNSARVGSPMSFSQSSPLLTGRKMSLSAADFDDDYVPTTSDIGGTYSHYQRGISPQNTGTSALLTPQTTGGAFLESIPRSTAFAAALEKARKLETGAVDNETRQLREGSASPKSLPQSRYLFSQNTGENISSETMSELVQSGIQVSERRKSYLAPQNFNFADIKDTIPLDSPDPNVAERFTRPPMIQVTNDLAPIPAEDEPPLSAFESQPCYQDQLHLLPTVTCSDCNEEISLLDLPDHHCDPPRSPLPNSFFTTAVIETESEPVPQQAEEFIETEVPLDIVSEEEPVDRVILVPVVEPPTPAEDEVFEAVAEPEDTAIALPAVTRELDTPASPTEPTLADQEVFTTPNRVEPAPPFIPFDAPESQIVPKTPLEAEVDDWVDDSLSELASEVEPDPAIESFVAPVEPIIHISPARTPELPEPVLREEAPEEPTPRVPDLIPVPSALPIVLEEPSSGFEPTVSHRPISPGRSPSQNSLSHRPVSMIVESPTRPTGFARGPFLVPSLPITSPEETEFGHVTFHRSSYSLSHSSDFVSHFAEPSSPPLLPHPSMPPSFSAVVHGKITELPANIGQLNSSQVARRHRAIRDSIPITPATGDLASLLANAALLERKLMQGELPSEIPEGEISEEPDVLSPNGTIDSVVEQLERWKPVEHIKAEDPKSRRKRSFRNPLGRSKSSRDSTAQADDFFEVAARARSLHDHGQVVHARAASTYHPLPPPVETHIRAHSQGSSLTIQTLQTLEPSPPTPPPKSPRSKYISGVRRFAGAQTRQSVSTSSEMSSDDSMLLITPPNRSPDVFATTNIGQLDVPPANPVTRSKTSIGWPSLATKKSLGSLGRASTFAEKIWSRKRTKSSSSSISSDFAERLAAESMHVPLPTKTLDISPLPSLPKVMVPPSGPLTRGHALRSKSFHSTRTRKDDEDVFLIPAVPPLPKPVASQSTSLLAAPGDIMGGKRRPQSLVSIATTSSSLTSPSPILDAFPAVPDSPPTLSPTSLTRPNITSFASLSAPMLLTPVESEPPSTTYTQQPIAQQ